MILVLAHLLNFFIVTKRISDWHHFCKWKFLYIVNSIGGIFCWNHVTDTLYINYAGDNICCNYAGFEVLLQLCRRYFLLQLCWWIFLLQLCRWLLLLQLCGYKFLQHLSRWVSAVNIWVTILIVIMQVGVWYNYAGGIFYSGLCIWLLLL